MKFNIDDYKGKYVMHCKTEEEAEIFCEYLHSIGRMWSTGESYLSERYWDKYKESTCYNFNYGTYCDKQYFEEAGYTILEMEDFMDKEKKELNYSNKKSIDHTGDVFKLLGLSPDEVFRIDNFFNTDYKITQELNVYMYAGRECWLKSEYTIADFLNGTLKIYKKPVPTEKEQLAIDYAKARGCKWIAKDKDDLIYAFTEKPHKTRTVWNVENGEFYVINIPISFIHWDDEEPYYIGY